MIDNSKERNVANALKKMCIDNGFLIIRINTTGVIIGDKMVTNDEGVGTADYIICHKGHFIAIETKSKLGKQTPRQKLFELRVNLAGGKYYIIRSLSDIQQLENDLKSL